MVEELCGFEEQINFDNVEYKVDGHFPNNDESSSKDNCSGSGDINVDIMEEVYAKPNTKSRIHILLENKNTQYS